MKNFWVIIFLTYSFQVLSASVSIPLKDQDRSKRPADDLIYQGERIDSYRALELLNQGLDLSQLNPYESKLWQDKRHSTSFPKPKNTHYKFEEYKRSPTEFFRAVVSQNGKRLVITASLENHGNILRAAMLRKLGYDITLPQYLKKASISFSSQKEKAEFLEKIGEETLTKRTRWLANESQDNILHLKDLTVESAELTNVNVFIPVMSRERQKQRRIFRSLLAIYKITDFPQSINAISGKVGRSFNNFLTFAHPYAKQFRDVSKQDLLWIVNRIQSNLSHDDFTEMVRLAGYPIDIGVLVREKIKSRINSLAQHLGLNQTFNANLLISTGHIIQGELKSDAYPQRVVEYFKPDEDSPYEFRDLFRLFRTQVTYNALSEVLDQAIERIVPGVTVNDAIDNISDQIADYRINNGDADGSVPVKVFSYPTAYVNASARRNVVFGQYLDNVAPIQLVDSVSADANLGVYSMITGVNDKVTPSVSASVGLSRTYSHVRAMPDLDTATSQAVEKILVPRLMKRVGSILKQEFACSLTDTVTVEESELNGDPIIYIKFDTAVEGSIELARQKRSELVAAGTAENTILLVPVQRKEECEAELKRQKDENLEEFLKELALNETFIISDSINMVGMGNAALPLDPILGQSLTLSAGADAIKGFLRGVFIRKKDGYIEVSIQRQKNFHKSMYLSLNYFIEVLRGTRKWLSGEQETLIYKIPTENITADRKDIVLKTIRELFVSNNTFYMDEHFDPIKLEHNVAGVLNTLQLLWYKSDSLFMDHTIEITLPQSQHPELSSDQLKKSLFSTSSIRRNGKNLFGFFNSILSSFSRFLNLGSGNADPGRTFQGSSKSRYYVSEADISEHLDDDRITTKIDYIWRGWSARRSTLNQIFTFIEGLFGDTNVNYHIDRTRFRDIGPLKSYEVKSTLIVYPEFFEKFKVEILNSSSSHALKIMKNLYGKRKWERYCDRRNRMGPRKRRRNRSCMPLGARTLNKLRESGLPNNKVARVKTYNSILLTLLEGFDRQRVIEFINPENFFASTRVTGFLENDDKGYVDYISNTYGNYNSGYGTGIFDQISAVLGITPYELRALNYTPGM